jgi:hypothetical protein
VTAGEPATLTADPAWLVERYEELREVSLAGRGDGPRLGLALLLRHGVSAWAAAWDSLAKAGPPASPARLDVPMAVPQSVVSLLASMALAASGAGQP